MRMKPQVHNLTTMVLIRKLSRFLQVETNAVLRCSGATQWIFAPLVGNMQKLHSSSVASQTVQPKTGILMLNMGGPRSSSEVHDFLSRLFQDRDIIQLPMQKYLGAWIAKRRTPDIIKKYNEIGGGSPIFKWTDLQGKLMCEKLDKLRPESAPHRHYVAFRYARPLTDEALTSMESDGVEHCIAFSQYPQYCCSTTGSSMNAIHAHYAAKKEPTNMRWSVIDRWCTNPHLVRCFAENIRSELEKFPEDKRKEVFILFSAHSVPMKQIDKGDPYPSEIGATVQLVMKELDFCNPFRLVWQSKVGPLPWLSPSTESTIEGLVKRGKKNLLLVPIAFTNDHIETLHELDIEYARDLGTKVGAEKIRRCPSPNDHPLFIEALVDEVTRHLETGHKCSEQFLNNCPICDHASCYNAKKWFRHITQKFN
uniref:Ferrochelatase n=1 Tax=Hirondellea gigas TaxID=1518452 RepID=A0A2P2I2L6_9CRUS